MRGLRDHLDVDVVELCFAATSRLRTLAADVAWYPRLRAPRSADVLHCPTFRAPFSTRTPLVVTVHDLAVLRHPGTFNLWTRHYSRLAVPRVVRAARVVIAVSEFTKRELVELLGVPEERVRVIRNGVDGRFAPEGPAAGGEYVLAVGTLEPRKNLARAQAAAARAGLPLKVAGAAGWGGVAANGWVGRPGDDELAALYRGARCLLYPSLYEGFGLPVAEAMACGTPVVTSRGGATEEVAGGAAVLVDPLDVASIAAGLEEALRRRDELRAAGLERARAFSWDAVAEATWRVYEEACS